MASDVLLVTGRCAPCASRRCAGSCGRRPACARGTWPAQHRGLAARDRPCTFSAGPRCFAAPVRTRHPAPCPRGIPPLASPTTHGSTPARRHRSSACARLCTDCLAQSLPSGGLPCPHTPGHAAQHAGSGHSPLRLGVRTVSGSIRCGLRPPAYLLRFAQQVRYHPSPAAGVGRPAAPGLRASKQIRHAPHRGRPAALIRRHPIDSHPCSRWAQPAAGPRPSGPLKRIAGACVLPRCPRCAARA